MLVLNLPFKALMFLTLMRPSLVFFFNVTATPEIYSLSLHDALPILVMKTNWVTQPVTNGVELDVPTSRVTPATVSAAPARDRKSTRLNSSHLVISYAVFCLKTKKGLLVPTQHAQTSVPSDNLRYLLG